MGLEKNVVKKYYKRNNTCSLELIKQFLKDEIKRMLILASSPRRG